MASAPSIPMIHDNCDYCLRDFGWTERPICTNCGLENVRKTIPISKEILADAGLLRETSMVAPAVEKAIAPAIQVRPPSRSAAVSKKTKKRGRR